MCQCDWGYVDVCMMKEEEMQGPDPRRKLGWVLIGEIGLLRSKHGRHHQVPLRYLPKVRTKVNRRKNTTASSISGYLR